MNTSNIVDAVRAVIDSLVRAHPDVMEAEKAARLVEDMNGGCIYSSRDKWANHHKLRKTITAEVINQLNSKQKP